MIDKKRLDMEITACIEDNARYFMNNLRNDLMDMNIKTKSVNCEYKVNVILDDDFLNKL